MITDKKINQFDKAICDMTEVINCIKEQNDKIIEMLKMRNDNNIVINKRDHKPK